MKTREGYVIYDERRKRYLARVTAFDPVTGKRTDIKRYKKTKTEALKEKRELLNKLEKDGAESFAGDRTRFTYLARKFREEKLIPAVYVGERKIAGRRELSAPRSWLLQLEYYFGEMKLPSITVGEIKKFEIWLSKIPSRSTIVEDENGKLTLNIKENGGQRGIESINRAVELLRTVLNYAVEEKMVREEQNPFSKKKARSLIDRRAESKREQLPTFGEEMALLDVCTGDRAHLRAVLIIAADSGLRRNELFTLSWKEKDIDFDNRLIRLRAINAKWNKARTIPMTQRAYEELLKLKEQYGDHPSGLVFGGIKEVKRSFNTACRMKGIEDLHKHDLRHAFVTRSILAGIPPAVVLKASGHSSDEWKRYLNVTPDMLHDLFTPLDGQESEAVKAYGFEVMRQLTDALMGSWKSGGNGDFFKEMRARVAMPTGADRRQQTQTP
jgi:integrase